MVPRKNPFVLLQEEGFFLFLAMLKINVVFAQLVILAAINSAF
ncbi:hypothetical protein JMA_20550 [Jeotgalibacillus malaysiensis]|uniref:Uncharacterized protein n=1 Tax=Jeotgalibacillus malaysiensis TaxID=1508404 RepID=A0A0B5ARV3_9BACL|nr:hypothetical protein JMA_20550 [Jeotgalibacillus malaysiensis]